MLERLNNKVMQEMEFHRIGKQHLPVSNPVPLMTSEALNQSWWIDFLHDALVCGRRFRTFNVVDNFNHEALAIDIVLNIPAQRGPEYRAG